MTTIGMGDLNAGYSSNIYELKPGTLNKAMEAAKSNGTKEVFIESEGKQYVIQSENLDLKSLKKGDVSAININLNGKDIVAQIKGFNNEVTNVSDAIDRVKGTAKVSAIIGAIGGVGAWAALADAPLHSTSEVTEKVVGEALGGGAVAIIGLGIAVLTLGGAAAYGVIKSGNSDSLKPFEEKKIPY